MPIDPKELVVISGKGGTGKTSLVAAFAAVGRSVVLADCDVDAADLHLVMEPRLEHREEFRSGYEAVIRQEACKRCGRCLSYCRYDAVNKIVSDSGEEGYHIDGIGCEGCGVCVWFCPEKAIDFPEQSCGEWFVSSTRFGPMVHARLSIAAENSGKLVTVVRNEARRIAWEMEAELVLIDGPPGIGCPVIASITGSSLVLVLTEPTLSGEHDLDRVLKLTRHFDIPAALCINKWDLNPEMAQQIESMALSRGIEIMGRIPYDPSVTAAMVQGTSVIEYENTPAARAMGEAWKHVRNLLQ